MDDDITGLLQKLDQIEEEMKQLDCWSERSPEGLNSPDPGPFGANVMVFTEWLQWVFLPIARECAARLDLPSTSQVGTQALREFDGWEEAGRLSQLLCEFDRMVEGRK